MARTHDDVARDRPPTRRDFRRRGVLRSGGIVYEKGNK